MDYHRASEMLQDASARSSLVSGAGERGRVRESGPTASKEDNQAALQLLEHIAPTTNANKSDGGRKYFAKGDSRYNPAPSSKAERERSPPRTKTNRARDASRHQSRKRGGGEKAWRRRLSSHSDGGRARSSGHSNIHTQSHSRGRSHRSGHTRTQSNSRNSLTQPQSIRRSQNNSRNSRSHSASGLTQSQSNTRSDSIRGSYGIRRTMLSRGGDGSERIGKIMRNSQRNLKYARQRSQRKLKHVHWDLSGESSSSGSDDESISSGSDDESISSESGDSSSSDEDGDKASVGNPFASWREKADPQEKMQSILDHFSRVAAEFASDFAGMREVSSQLKEEEVSANKVKWYASKQLKDAQEQQTYAAEREDYEVADELGTVIKGNTKALKKQTQIYQGIRERMAKMDEKKEAAVKSATLCLKEAQVELSELHDELVQHAKEDKGVASHFYEESNRLSSKSECLAQELKAIEQEEESFAIEKEEVVGGKTKELEEELQDARCVFAFTIWRA